MIPRGTDTTGGWSTCECCDDTGTACIRGGEDIASNEGKTLGSVSPGSSISTSFCLSSCLCNASLSPGFASKTSFVTIGSF